MKSLIFLPFAFLAVNAFATPPTGIYELYNGEGVKTGVITSSVTISSDKSVTHILTQTKIEYPGVSGNYRFTEIDSGDIGKQGLLSLRRETNDNGQKDLYIVTRRDKDLLVQYDRRGQKYSAAFSTTSFAMTEFEMDLPNSPFRTIKPGQSLTLKIFFLDRVDVLPVARSASEIQQLNLEGEQIPVLVLTTIVEGKISKSWFHAKTGDLLQEEGKDYLMSRISE